MFKKQKILIIPGWNGSKETWSDFIDLLSEKYEVICFDLPCFGKELCPEQIWGIEDYAEWLKNKIMDIDGKFAVLGHSFGGQVAVYLVANYPEKFSYLILSGAAVYRPKRYLKRFVFQIIAKTGKFIFSLPLANKLQTIAQKILYRLAKSPDYISTDGIKREIFKKVIREDVSQYLGLINIPSLLVWGKKDTYIPLKYAYKIKKKLKKAELTVIKNGRHGLHLNNKKEFLSAIINFLQKYAY